MNYRVREDCRLCGSRTLTKALDLPATPLANEFPTAARDLHVSALAEVGVMLFLVTVAFNVAARVLVSSR